MTKYLKQQVDEICVDLNDITADYDIVACSKAATMLEALYTAWRDSVSQSDDLRKQRDEARLEVARLKDHIEDMRFRANSYLDEEPCNEAIAYVCEPLGLKITYI